MSQKSDIAFDVATMADEQEIRQFVVKHFYSEEPITSNHYEDLTNDEDVEDTISFLPEELTIKAIDSKTGRIIGLIVAHEVKPHFYVEARKSIVKAKTKKWADVQKILLRLDELSNIFERYQVKRLAHSCLLSINPDYRNTGLSYDLTTRSMEHARRKGFTAWTCDCTNVYTVRMAENLAMQCVHSLAFKDFKDENGQAVFQPPPPNTHVKKYIAKL